MQNEILLILSLIISFGTLLFVFKLFGENGIYAWIGICAILANIEVTILVKAFSMEQTLGNTLFASSFLATDILSEFYGKKSADKAVKIGVFTTFIFIIFSNLWLMYIPSQADWAMPSIKTLFSNTPRILTASLLAYTVSEFIDVRLYHKIWKITENKTGSNSKMLWARNNFSTLISQFINIVLFNFGAFLGTYDFNQLIKITLSCYVIYIATSLLDTPFMYIAKKIGSPKNIS